MIVGEKLKEGKIEQKYLGSWFLGSKSEYINEALKR